MSGRLFIRRHFELPTPETAMTGGEAISVDDGFAVRISEIEGAVAEIELSMRQTGWQTIAIMAPKAASVAWSATGLSADAILLAIGRLAEVPGDLFSPQQTLRYLCAPSDIETSMLAFAKANLDTQPQVDWLVADASPTDPEAYLAGRSRVFRVDPVSHAVSTYDEIVGDRIVDLSDLALAGDGRLSDKPGLYDAPVATLRTRVVADWTQVASGEVNIGGRIPPIRSLDPNVGSNIQNHVVFRNAEGWTALGGEAKTTRTGVRVVDVGSRYRLKRSYRQRRTYAAQVAAGGGHVDIDDVVSTPKARNGAVADDVVTTVQPALQSFRHEVTSFAVSYDYQQPRRETLFAVLDCPRPPFATVTDVDDREEPDFELTIGDVFTDHSIPEYEEDADYTVGTVVRRADRYYECLEDHFSERFDQVRPGYEQDMENRSFWERVYPDVPTPATMTRFFSTDRGKLFCRHVLLRMRKEALRRLRLRHVVLTYRWQDAAHVRLQDSIRFLIPWGDGTYRSVFGKVYSIDRTWDGVSNPLVSIEAAVSFGQTDFVPEPVEVAYEPEHRLETTGGNEPVQAWRLVSSNYAAPVVQIVNDANDQVAALSSVISGGGRPEDASVRTPTTIDVTLQPIQATGTLEGEADLSAFLDRSPRGIAL